MTSPQNASNNRKKIVWFILILCLQTISVQVSAQIKDADNSYLNARTLAFSGEYKAAQDTLTQIIAAYPEYIELQAFLAKTYSWSKDYEKARQLFSRITDTNKHSSPLWVAAIKNEQYSQNLDVALRMANEALVYLPEDKELHQLHEVLAQASATRIQDPTNDTQNTRVLILDASGEVFDQVLDPMLYGAITYQHKAKWGTVMPRLNYHRRFNINGLQSEIDIYPNLGKTTSAYVNYGFSNAEIFPNHRVGVEVTQQLPKGIEVSLGVRHLTFPSTTATIFTGSFGLYRGNYYATFRPFVIPDKNRGLGLSGNVQLRRYLKSSKNYLGLQLVYGFDTEINQFIANGTLLSETLIYLEAQRIRAAYQFINSKNSKQYTLHIGANRQEFAFGSGRLFFSVNAGLSYQFKL